MRFLSVTALALVALVLAACSGGTTPTTAPSASAPASGAPAAGGTPTVEDLEGRSFVVTAAEGYEVVPDSSIVLQFGEGRIVIEAGCNTMGTQFGIQDGLLTMGEMIQTEKACAPALMAQDQFMSDFLYNTTIVLDGDTLTLTKDAVSMTLTDREVAQPDLPLEGTTWVVNSMIDTTSVSSMPDGVEATLVFSNGEVQVNSGCNTGSGPATISEDTITFGPIATTRMACDDATMEAEGAILVVLQGEVNYVIESTSLALTGDESALFLNAQE